ncbi:hypothetical protein Mzhil_1193 [Methanosalsum zhilinae DSM 4017]|uniref:YgjV family protein n=1 Tax=Methanosalsum zhilinae (strain DSM 4017 / NBRC 107636 / OCM 62 / WeN5) TaxID=679901 RepID=F7XMN3_METZD|nr:hypothetical protein [Methanosalsum zhilinae]AEH61048.1 hypothetical protein Mzhil_1193 [Methanosalsum zhilinae DSM 4017]
MEWQIVEIIGYVGSAIWVISFMMSSTFRLRLFNLFGAASYVVYGLLIGANPIALVNGLVALLNVYHLMYMKSLDASFDVLEVPVEGSTYVERFLKQHEKNIQKVYPNFREMDFSKCYAIFTLRNFMPAGVCIYEVIPDGRIQIKLDYICLNNKDIKGTISLYNDYREYLRNKGYWEILIEVTDKKYKDYLCWLGYYEDCQYSSLLRKRLID